MAVYTTLTQEQAERFVAEYDIGMVAGLHPIAEGIENTNYLLEMRSSSGESARYILTLFEKRVKPQELPYFVALMEHLSTRGVDCPKPVRDRRGEALQPLDGKSALIVTFVEGRPLEPADFAVSGQPESVAADLGAFCAQLHIAGQDFPLVRLNDLSLAGWRELSGRLAGRADEIIPGLSTLIDDELAYLASRWPQNLPAGPVHADLFPDNVFFSPVSGPPSHCGVIDWYFACHDAWMYDLAIVINAWGFFPKPEFAVNMPFISLLLAAYTQQRAARGQAVQPEEWEALPILCRGAALRFLLTRAYDWLNPVEGALVTTKDPKEYLAKLCFFRDSFQELGAP